MADNDADGLVSAQARLGWRIVFALIAMAIGAVLTFGALYVAGAVSL